MRIFNHIIYPMAMKTFVSRPPRSCLICNTHVYNSNKMSCCRSCSGFVHTKCTGYTDPSDFICITCLADDLPFLCLSKENEFYNAVRVLLHEKKTLVLNSGNKKLNLNPHHGIDDNLINNPDIDVDSNHYDAININDYYNACQLNKILRPTSLSGYVHSMMHVNTCRLIPHIDSLYSSLQFHETRFSVIAITETWTTPSNENMAKLPGYSSIIKSREGKMGGGVAFYFDDDLKLNIKLRSDLLCENMNIMESLFVQVAQHGIKDIILGVIYRPPNTNVNDFVLEMGVILDRIDRESKPCYLMGDFNIDLLNKNSGSESFLNLMFLHGMYPRIDRPTRITDASATLIDNIFTNVYNTQLNGGVWVADIADHLPVYTILPYKDGTNQLHSIPIT